MVSRYKTGRVKYVFKSFRGIIKESSPKVIGGKYISVGQDTEIDGGVRLYAIDKSNSLCYNPEIVIGNHCRICKDSMIATVNRVVIGNNVAIAARSIVIDAVHGEFRDHKLTFENGSEVPDVFLQNIFTRDLVAKGPIIIEDNVHIAENCILLPGTIIGKNSVIGANSVVSGKIPPYSLVSGNPATIIMTFGKKINK
jgi:acetyltransferase-like isoleucine patch superfamily enzyme